MCMYVYVCLNYFYSSVFFLFYFYFIVFLLLDFPLLGDIKISILIDPHPPHMS